MQVERHTDQRVNVGYGKNDGGEERLNFESKQKYLKIFLYVFFFFLIRCFHFFCPIEAITVKIHHWAPLFEYRI